MLRRAAMGLCCMVIALLIPFGALATTYSMAGFDGDDSRHEWKDNAFFTRMEARTGINFTFEEYTDFAAWQTAKQRMADTGVWPDVLFKAELTTREQIELADQGILTDLAPLLAENAPNLWALLQQNPDWLAAITLPDGKIVALPTLTTLATQNAMWINRTWLDELGLETPTDLESLTRVLTAFKTGDPNQNGSADEIPLTFLGAWDLKFLAHAVGLVANDYNLYVEPDGTVNFLPLQEGYFTLLAWLRDSFANGLLDPDGFTTADSLRVVSDEKAVAQYGLLLGPNPMNLLPYAMSEQYELLLPLTSGGKQVYRDLYGPVMRGTFAITSACKDPAALLRWVDILYTPDGAAEAMAGKAGEDYVLADDGTWTFAGDLESVSSYVLYNLSIYDSGNMPWLFPLEFYNRYQNASITRVNQALTALSAYTVRPFPVYTLTPAQEDEIAPLQNEIGRYVDESLARFVTGEWDIRDPAAVAAYREGFQALNLPAFMDFWQKIADGLTK